MSDPIATVVRRVIVQRPGPQGPPGIGAGNAIDYLRLLNADDGFVYRLRVVTKDGEPTLDWEKEE
jgi:hypothetical protein